MRIAELSEAWDLLTQTARLDCIGIISVRDGIEFTLVTR